MKFRVAVVGLLLGTTPAWLGCEVKRTADAPPTGQSNAQVHKHEHPEHGAHGGHVSHFDTSPSTHFEWAHDDDAHLLTVFFEELVSGGANVESVVVRVTSSGSEKTFTLKVDDKAKIAGSVFQAKDEELTTLIGASGDDPKGVQAKLVATIDGKEESVLLIDDHHHH